MKGEALLFYILVIYIICCVILQQTEVFSINQFLTNVLVGCCMFLMYYVLRYIGKILELLANYLLDVLCKLSDWLIPIAKNVSNIVLVVLYVIAVLSIIALSLYIFNWLFGDCSGHMDIDHVHFEKF